MQPRARGSLDAAEGASSRAEAKAAAPAQDAAVSKKAETRLGTGHGDRLSAPTQYTDFRRASDSPSDLSLIPI